MLLGVSSALMVWKIAAHKPFLEQLWWQTGCFCCHGGGSPGRLYNSWDLEWPSSRWRHGNWHSGQISVVVSLNICLEPCYFRQLLRPVELGKRGDWTAFQLLCKIKSERGEKQHAIFSLPLINHDNKSFFKGGRHKSCPSGGWHERCEIILWSSCVTQVHNGYCCGEDCIGFG